MSVGPNTDLDSQALPIGLRLEEFEILSKIGEGGFSIVYKARDLLLEREVALKEYLPSSIAYRGNQTQVGVRSERNRQTFEVGLSSFIREAQTLASFNHPGLVRVFRFFQANGTAYMVMPLYVGRTLRTVVEEMHAPPDEAWLMHLLHPLMDVLESVHAQDWYHRDIAPDNIMLVDGESRPILLDFGAARQVVGDMTQALTVVLKPGYAPIEQYAAIAEIKQGPWTDVYALAATVHWVITGKTPPIAAGRILQDSHIPLAIAAQGKYSNQFLCGLDAALKVKPADRTQDIGQFRCSITPAEVPKEVAKVEHLIAPVAFSPAADRPLPEPVAPVLRADAKRGPQPIWIGLAAVCGIAGLTLVFNSRTPTPNTTLTDTPGQFQPVLALPLPPKPQPLESPPAPLANKPPVVQQPILAMTTTLSSSASTRNNNAKQSLPEDQRPIAQVPSKKSATHQSSACEELLRKLSLGDTDADLINQLSANGCSSR